MIAGRKVLNEHLALGPSISLIPAQISFILTHRRVTTGVYALTGVGAYLAMSGDSKPKLVEKPVASNSSSVLHSNSPLLSYDVSVHGG